MSARLRVWLRGFRFLDIPQDLRRRKRLGSYRPALDRLEDRLAPAAVPIVTLTAPSSPFIGANIGLAINFTNPSASGATAPGFAPWDYVVLPRAGFQGTFPGTPAANAYDGISFNTSVTPTYLGAAVTYQEIDVTATGQVTGPSFAAKGASGAPIVLTGLTPGNQVVFFQLPFGSFAVNQPGGTINFGGTVSNLATVAQPLTMTVGGGFSFGNDSLKNPATDPPLISATTTATATPTLFTITKKYLGPENETATGPNFPEQYEIDVSVAPGQTITNLQITDALPNSEQWLGSGSIIASANGGAYTGLTGTTATTTTPGGNLIANFSQVVGTGGATDASLVFGFYVPEVDATSAAVLPLGTGAFQTITNTATAAGAWTPLDPRDAATPVTLTSAPVTITAKSIAEQKTVAVVGGSGKVVQGATLQYTINFQVSDYFAFNQLNLADLLPDGVRFDSTFTPTLTVTQHTGNSAAAGFQSSDVTVGGVNSDGSQTVNFAVSNELIAREDPAGGDLIGGDIPSTGTGGAQPGNTNPSLFAPGTTGQIVFRGVIQSAYSVRASPLGDKTIKQGDTLTNTVPDRSNAFTPNTGGQVLNYANLAGTGTFQADTTSATVTVAVGSLDKSIYAIDGSTAVVSPYQVQTGDTITYRLTYTMPTGAVEKLTLNDFLPLPIFDATNGGSATAFTFDNIASSTAPAAYHAQFGPSDQYLTRFETGLGFAAPTISTPTDGTNRAIIAFPQDLQDPQQRTTTVDILFTVPILDKAVSDGLFLTNQANSQEGNTAANVSTANTIAQIQLEEPNLSIVKSVVSSTIATRVFGPITFSNAQIGTTNQRWTGGTISSNDLTSNPININLTLAQAGDKVEFAIIVQNTGTGPDGAFDVALNDSLPAGFLIPAAGLNLQVRDGTGTALSYTTIGAGLFDSTGGIQLTDPGAQQGSLTSYSATSGKNIAVITYDLQIEPNSTLSDAVRIGQVLTNTASLNKYAAEAGGVNYLPTALTEPASVTIATPTNTKSLVSTSEASTTGNNVAIGEIVRYHLVVQIPQSSSPTFQIVDSLPAGMSYLNDGTTKVGFVSVSGSALTSSDATLNGLAGLNFTGTSAAVTPTAVLPSGDISGGTGTAGAFVDGNHPVFSFSTITDTDATDANLEYIVLDFNALVDNNTTNTTGHTDVNNFADRVAGATVGSSSNNVTVTIVQPTLTTAKSVAPSTVQIGSAVAYTIIYTNTGNNDAFDSVLTDTLNAALTFTSISIAQSANVTGVTNNSNLATNNVNVSVGDIPVGSNVTLTVNATVNAATVGTPIPNTANAVWTSLPGTGTANGSGGNSTGSTTAGASGASNGERNGTTAPLTTNTYASTGSASLTITNPAPVKAIVATSEASTTGSNVAIGEIVRYSLAVQIPHATSPTYQIVDQLPAGLSFLNDGTTDVAFVSASGTTLTSSDATINGLAGLNFAGSSASVTPTAAFPSGDISGGTGTAGAFLDGDDPVFSFSTVTNSDANNANPAYIVLQFNVLVDNIAGNTTGQVDANTFINKVSGAQAGLASNVVNVTIAQPAITNTTKTVQSTGRDPGDTIAYRVTYSNTGTSDAFDSRLLDSLPATLSLNVGSVTFTLGGGAIGATNNSSGNNLDVTIGDVPVGGTVQIDYTATIVASDAANSSITNTANLSYTSLPGGFGTTVNATGSSTPGASGSANGERNGAGGVDSYVGSSSQTITLNTSTLTGFVYQDLNNNAVKNTGENGIPGVTVTLTGNDINNNPVSTTTTTNASGQYTFANLLPSNAGGYTIAETQPSAFLDGKETPTSTNFTGTVGAGSNVGSNSASDVFSGIIIGPESALTGANFNFGELPPATVSGSVYIDANNDGVKQGGETGITGVQVELQGTDDLGNTVAAFANTNSAGSYSFATVRPGTYFVTEPTQPTGYLDGLDNLGNTAGGVIAGSANGSDRVPGSGTITLAVGATSANNMFGELLPASLAGFVYVDANNDGVKQAGDAGLSGVTVTLTGTNDLGASINQPVTTLSTGAYSFTNLRPGTYTVTESQPTGYVQGKDTIGTPGGNATVQDVFSNIVLNEAVNGTANNFGERLTADLAINKTDGQTTAIPGSSITYTITITNNGPSTVNTLTMTDAVPATILSPVFSGASSGSFNSGTGVWTGLTLAPTQSITIQLTGTVSPSATGSLANTATVSNAQDGSGNAILDSITGNNSSTDTDTLASQVDLSITKTDGSATYTAGAPITYTIVATNGGPILVSGATVTDAAPSTISGATWTAVYVGTGSTGPASGTGSINTTVSLAAGGTATFTFNGTVLSTATGNLANTATIAVPAGLTDPDLSNNSATDTDTPNPVADLSITKTDGQTTAIPGNAITYIIVATNSGPSFVTAATVADNIPATITGATWTAVYTGVGSTGPVSGTGSINASVNLANGGTATFTLTGTVASTATGTLSNTATVAVSEGTTDNNSENNSATDTDTLTPQGDLSITKTDGSATYTAGTPISYTIVASNSGPSFVTAATVADAAPATISGVTWTAVYVGGTGPTSGTGSINATINLASGGTATFTFSGTVLSTATGNLSNTATITAPTGFTDTNTGNNSATDTDTPNPISDLAITKTDGQTTAIPGNAITYTIVATNNGPSFVTAASVADNIPATITGATWTAIYTGIGSTGPVSGNGSINASVNLANGGTATFTLTGTVASTATGTLSNTATIAVSEGATDNNSENNSATDTDTLTPQGDLSITKTDGSATYTAGTAISYTIVATNSGPSFVTAATVADVAPSTISGVTWTAVYVGGTGPTSGTGSINAAVNLASGGTATFTFSGTVRSTATGNLSNTATITAPAGFTDSNPDNDSATDTDTPNPVADLAITKTDGQTSAIPGNAITYTIVATNNGPSFVTAATVADSIPATITGATWTAIFTGVGSTGPVSGTGSINASVNLANGGTATFTLTGTVASTATGTLSNTATVAVSEGATDNNSENNSATDTDTLTPQGDLSITKTDGSATYTAGTAISYTIVATNSGPSYVTAATVADVAPANISGVTWTAVYVGGTGPTSGTGSINAAVNLASGGTVTFTFSGTVLSTATGNLANTATITAPTGFTDGNPENNSATDTDTPNPIADLAVTKSGPPFASANDTVTYTITVTNNGPSDARAVSFSDPTPANTTFVSQTQINGPAFTLAAPAGNVIDAIADLGSGTTATFQIVLHVNNPVPPGTVLTNIAAVASTTFDPIRANNSFQVQTDVGGTIVSGFAFIDNNSNGTKDAGEPNLSGVNISLVDSAGNLIATTATAGDGSYSFAVLAIGAYTIVETQPLGYGSSTSNSIPITLPADGLTNANFGATVASLGGSVFFDGNNDGVQQAGEPGIPGVTVALTGTDIYGSAVIRTAITTVTGTFGFAGLLTPSAAGYTITETQPANFAEGIDSVGAAGGVVTVQDVVSTVHLNAGQNAPGYNFGERGTVVAGNVFLDLNRNGVLNAGEPGKGGVPVVLLNSTGNTVASTLSNPDGSYLFSGITAGAYRIVESPPGGFTPSTPVALSVAVPAAGLLNQNFGLTTPTGSLAGTVFVDLNNNGIQQPGEPGIAGVSITLTSGVTVLSAITAADGTYVFTNLPAGSYVVAETQPAGYAQGLDRAGASGGNTTVQDAISAISLGAGVNATGYTFGESGARLSGTVFNDANADGILDAGETGRAGVTVTLRDSKGNLVATTASAVNGAYGFGPLVPGTFTVTEAAPAGLTTTSPIVLNVTVPPVGLAGQNFGLNAASNLAGSVYFDANNDGNRQTGEPGIAGVTVTLTGVNNLTIPVNFTTTTAANGSFVFANLQPSNAGGYTVTESQPAGYGEGHDQAGSADGVTTVQDVISNVAVGANVNATGYLFGEISAPANVTLAGVVFVDNNGTGNPAGQPPLGGVSLDLKNNLGGTIATTTTAADGSYSFANVAPGSDSIVESQPTGYGNSAATPVNTIPVTVTAGSFLTGNNFGETLGSLSGNIFADNNNDGVFDGPDFGIAGVTVSLQGSAGNLLQTTTSDANGNYHFLGLTAGTYTVVEAQPARYVTGQDLVGSLGENVVPHIANQFSVGVAAGVNGVAYNFAEIPTADPLGYVWEDRNNNGIREPAAPTNEPGIANVTITMTGTDILGNIVSVTTTTDATGLYQFTFRNQAHTLPLLPGVYNIAETPPTAYLNGKLQNGTPPAATVANRGFAGINLSAAPFFGGDYNFGELRPSSLSGFVFVDPNNNGIRDAGDPGVVGATVILTGTDDLGHVVNATVVTDGNGNFSFQRMRPGTYTLTELQPATLVNGLTRAGVGVSVDGSAGINVITGIVVSENQNGTAFRFAELGLLPQLISKRQFLSTSTPTVSAGPAGSGVTYVKPIGNADPSGFVYFDRNNNGVKDPGEPGIPKVLMTLTGVTDSGDFVDESQYTNAQGLYRFDQLEPGIYAVTEAQPAGFLPGKESLGTLGGSKGDHQFDQIVLRPTDIGTGYDFGQMPVWSQPRVWVPDFAMDLSLIPLATHANRIDSLFADAVPGTPASPQPAAKPSRKPGAVSNRTSESDANKPVAGKRSFLGSLWNKFGFGD